MLTVKLSLPFLLLLCLVSGYSQNTIGVIGGYSVSWIDSGDAVIVEKGKEAQISGLNLSTFYSREFNKSWSIEVAPSYSQRGGLQLSSGSPSSYSVKYELDYLQFPIAISKKFILFQNKIMISAGGGYSLNRLIRANGKIVGPVETGPLIDVFFPSFRSLRKFDHGFFAQVRLGYMLSYRQVFFVEVSKYNGIRNYYNRYTSKNRSVNFDFGAGYSF